MASLVKIQSENTGSSASQEIQKGLVTTGANHVIGKPERELSLTLRLEAKASE